MYRVPRTNALDRENFWLSIEPQVPDEGRTSRRREGSMAFATAKTPSTVEAVYRPLCQASASSVAALPVPRQVERFVNSRPLRQLHRWHSGIIGHGRTDWMKSDNCRFHPAMTRNTPWTRGVEKGGAAGSGIGNRGPPASGANSYNEN